VAVGPYRDLLRQVVVRMKQAPQQITAYQMGRLLALRRRRGAALQDVDLVIPMPKYWWDRIRRGTNSAEWIARGIAGVLRAPLRQRVLIKTRATHKQSLLSESQRQRNVRGALSVRRPAAVQGRRVLLVDDLMTTGSTLDEATRILLQAGAERVSVAVVARAQSLGPTPRGQPHALPGGRELTVVSESERTAELTALQRQPHAGL
jgi:ComF family protein